MEVQPIGQAQGAAQMTQAETAEDQSFLDALQKLDEYIESQRKTPAEKRQEEAAAQAERVKKKKMAELQLRIAALRSRVNMGFKDAEGELALLQGQLLHLQLFG